MIRAPRRDDSPAPRLAVLLALVLAAVEIDPVIRGVKAGEFAWLASLVLLLLYSAAAILLARGSRAGAIPALAAGGPAIVVRGWSILTTAFHMEYGFHGENLKPLVANLLVAACNALLIQDAFAQPLDPPPRRARLLRIRDVPSRRLLLAQLLLGSALLGVAVFGGPESWRHGKISAALFGTALLVYVTAILIAKGIDAVDRTLIGRRVAR